MDDLLIPATQYTPSIVMRSSGKIEIKGKSYPENTFDFYKPVLLWLKNYLASPESNKHLHITYEIVYFNSSSSQVSCSLFDLFVAHKH